MSCRRSLAEGDVGFGDGDGGWDGQCQHRGKVADALPSQIALRSGGAVDDGWLFSATRRGMVKGDAEM